MAANIKIDFDEFITTFNKKGKNEAITLAKEKYNLSFQQVRRRLMKSTDYFFDTSLRIYKHRDDADIENNFMTIEELNCSKTKENFQKRLEPLPGLSPSQSFEDLVKELMKDRLMELSKYVSINRETKSLIINTKNLKKDCFELIEI